MENSFPPISRESRACGPPHIESEMAWKIQKTLERLASSFIRLVESVNRTKDRLVIRLLLSDCMVYLQRGSFFNHFAEPQYSMEPTREDLIRWDRQHVW